MNTKHRCSQEVIKTIWVIFVIVKCLFVSVVAVQPLKIISIVSNSSDADTPLWGRGEELIPGALLAAEQVNSNEDVLNGFHIEVVPLFVQDCSVSEGILKTVKELLSTDHPVIGVTGLFCPRLVEVLSPLLSHREISLIQLSGAIIKNHAVAEGKDLPHTFNILSGIKPQLETLFNLMEALNWSRFNLVTIRSTKPLEDYYTILAEQLMDSSMMNSNRSFEIHNLMLKLSSMEHFFNQLRLSSSRIIVAALPPETAVDLLCHAFKNKMTWPRYGWIMLDLTVNESAQCGGESLLRAMENVIVLQTKLEQDDNLTLVSGNSYINYTQSFYKQYSYLFNPYTNVLYDSVWALALAVNSSLQRLWQSNQTPTSKNVLGTQCGGTNQIYTSLLKTSFIGSSGVFQNGQIRNYQRIHQIQNESFVSFGKQYSYELELLNESRPHDEIPRIYQLLPVAVTVVMFVGISLCGIFVTALLVLFFWYWKEPEVCASSRALSLCIFLGSYLLLASALSNTEIGGIAEEPSLSICTIIVDSCFIGIDLILATVLAKTLRIAYVFTKFKKTGKACSDIALLAMIALIVLGKIIILVLWSAIDLHHVVEVIESVKDDDGLLYYQVFQRCHSQQTVVWLLIIVTYTTAIGIPLLVLAYKTRKIKQEHFKHFKNTKKISALIVSLIIIGAFSIPLWGTLRVVGKSQVSTYVANFAYTAIPIVCQVFLIIPKLGPSLKESFSSYRVFLVSKDTAIETTILCKKRCSRNTCKLGQW